MYRYYALKFLDAHPRPTRLDVQAYLAGRLGEGVSPSAVKNMQKALISLFVFLAGEGLWPEDIMAGLKSIKVTRTEKYMPPLADVERVLAEGGWARKKDADKMRLLIVLLMETGLRITEATTIEKEKVDLEARVMEVLGKGNKVRKVPLSEPIVAYLTQYMEEHTSGSVYLFPGEGVSLKHWQIHNAEKTLKRACERAGVAPFTPHALRHLFATMALRNGAKLEVVSRILGHASIGITGDIYRHVNMDEMQRDVDLYGPMAEK
jgi:site-specific recombinase XerD